MRIGQPPCAVGSLAHVLELRRHDRGETGLEDPLALGAYAGIGGRRTYPQLQLPILRQSLAVEVLEPRPQPHPEGGLEGNGQVAQHHGGAVDLEIVGCVVPRQLDLHEGCRVVPGNRVIEHQRRLHGRQPVVHLAPHQGEGLQGREAQGLLGFGPVVARARAGPGPQADRDPGVPGQLPLGGDHHHPLGQEVITAGVRIVGGLKAKAPAGAVSGCRVAARTLRRLARGPRTGIRPDTGRFQAQRGHEAVQFHGNVEQEAELPAVLRLHVAPGGGQGYQLEGGSSETESVQALERLACQRVQLGIHGDQILQGGLEAAGGLEGQKARAVPAQAPVEGGMNAQRRDLRLLRSGVPGTRGLPDPGLNAQGRRARGHHRPVEQDPDPPFEVLPRYRRGALPGSGAGGELHDLQGILGRGGPGPKILGKHQGTTPAKRVFRRSGPSETAQTGDREQRQDNRSQSNRQGRSEPLHRLPPSSRAPEYGEGGGNASRACSRQRGHAAAPDPWVSAGPAGRTKRGGGSLLESRPP